MLYILVVSWFPSISKDSFLGYIICNLKFVFYGFIHFTRSFLAFHVCAEKFTIIRMIFIRNSLFVFFLTAVKSFVLVLHFLDFDDMLWISGFLIVDIGGFICLTYLHVKFFCHACNIFCYNFCKHGGFYAIVLSSDFQQFQLV